MRISMPIDVWDPERGGAERYLNRLAIELGRRGNEVTVLCLEARENASDGPARPRIELINAPRFPRWRRELRFAEECVRAHRQSGRDVLLAVRHALEADVYQPHGGPLPAARAAASRSLPAWRRAARDVFASLRPSLRVLRWLDRQVFLRSPRVITVAVSGKVEVDFRRTYPDIDFRFERIYNPVDTDRLHDSDRAERAAALRSWFAIPEGSRIVVFAAHRFRPKGLGAAVRAIEGAAGWHLVVAGRDRPGPFACEAKRRGLLDRVHFAGAVGDMRGLFAGADALLHPTYYDPCSLTVLEAMACGTPAITTRQNGASELIEQGQSGFIVDSPASIDALSAALTEIGRRWETFHAEARRVAAGWGWKPHVDRIEKVLFRALAKD